MDRYTGLTGGRDLSEVDEYIRIKNRDLERAKDQAEGKLIIIDNLIESVEKGTLPEIPLIEIDRMEMDFWSALKGKGTAGGSFSKNEIETFRRLNCNTLKEAFPYLLSRTTLVFNEQDIEEHNKLYAEWKIVNKKVRSETSILERAADSFSIIIFYTVALSYLYINRPKEKLNEEDSKMIDEALKNIHRPTVIDKANLRIYLKKAKNDPSEA